MKKLGNVNDPKSDSDNDPKPSDSFPKPSNLLPRMQGWGPGIKPLFPNQIKIKSNNKKK